MLHGCVKLGKRSAIILFLATRTAFSFTKDSSLLDGCAQNAHAKGRTYLIHVDIRAGNPTNQ